MSIGGYFSTLSSMIHVLPWVQISQLQYETRLQSAGFVRGTIFFVDESVLHVRKFISLANNVERIKYVYQYMTSSRQLIFRYDNAQDRQWSGLPTYPHHKHEGSEENVVASDAPTLEEVLQEIGRLMGT